MYSIHPTHSHAQIVLQVMVSWDEPDWVYVQNMKRLHAHDCHQNVTKHNQVMACCTPLLEKAKKQAITHQL